MKKRGTGGRAPYVVPRYRTPGEPAFYHLLHGAVPGHQLDFIYAPAVPQGALTQTHLAHAARLAKYIEPREKVPFAFAIGNLSRDDVQHEPGHGGLMILLCLRVEGVMDHASRAMPPFAHGLVAVDRALDGQALTEATLRFAEVFLDSRAHGAASFYKEYVLCMRERPEAAEGVLAGHVASFDALPQPRKSDLGADFVAPEDEPPERVTILHADDAPLESLIRAAAEIAGALYRSSVKWTAVSSGREGDIPGGTTVRFVPASEAPRSPRGPLLQLDELPAGDAELLARLFSAAPRALGAAIPGGWRARLAEKTGLHPPDEQPSPAVPKDSMVEVDQASENKDGSTGGVEDGSAGGRRGGNLRKVAVALALMAAGLGLWRLGGGAEHDTRAPSNRESASKTFPETPGMVTAPSVAVPPSAGVAATASAVPTATVAPTATAVPTATVAPTATAAPSAMPSGAAGRQVSSLRSRARKPDPRQPGEASIPGAPGTDLAPPKTGGPTEAGPEQARPATLINDPAYKGRP